MRGRSGAQNLPKPNGELNLKMCEKALLTVPYGWLIHKPAQRVNAGKLGE
jgi:hypothetical protein